MATGRATKRTRLREYVAQRRPSRITAAEWEELSGRLAPISESYLRRLLRDSGVPLDPAVEGVRQDSFEELERTLLALAEEYAGARAGGRREAAAMCRRAVVTAKDHARLSLRRATEPGQRARKEEMISWMLVWLENPEAFPVWLRLRKQAARHEATESRSTGP